MMKYEVIIPEKPERQIKKLDRITQMRVMRRLLELRENPDLGKPLHHCKIWSLRVGKYRVRYEINMNKKRVEIKSVRHRKKAYQ